MDIGIVGGGINGLCCAWELARGGHYVTLYEKDMLMQATSRSSSKLLHGGFRYLENGQLRLVSEALHERDLWLSIVPHLAKPLPIIYPKYKSGKRSKWLLDSGFMFYSMLSRGSALPGHRWISDKEVYSYIPELKTAGLQGGYRYYDAQMDDYMLGLWVAQQCRELGVEIKERTAVRELSPHANIILYDGTERQFDRLINVAGPWAESVLKVSNIKTKYQLDLIRGSHLIINRISHHALILEVPDEMRIFFVLPWHDKTIIGTTEVRQSIDDQIQCSNKEISYLIDSYNYYFISPINKRDIFDVFSGLRPLIRSCMNPQKVSREYAIQRKDKLITVFGGKWTTAMALARKVKKSL